MNKYSSNTLVAKIWFFSWVALSAGLVAGLRWQYNMERIPFIFLICVVALFGSLPALVILLSGIEGFVNKKCDLPQKFLRLLLLQLLCCSLYGGVTYIVTGDSGVSRLSAAGITIAVIFGCNSFSVLWNQEALKKYFSDGLLVQETT